MIGADRNVRGGVSSVVNQYYAGGLDRLVDLKYIATMKDGSKFAKLIVMLKALLKFATHIKSYDILHVHMSSRNSFWRKRLFINIAKRNCKKVVIHMHGSEFDVFYEKECSKRQQRMIRETFALVDAVIVLSEEWKRFFCNICNQDKISVIYNAVKLPNFERQNYNDKNVLFLGRLGERKGTFDLINAIPKVVDKLPDVQFYLGGDGDVEKCKAQCERLGINKNVTFLGWLGCDEKVAKLETCSTFILPSYHEGLPMAVLEAMSYGEVVIATVVGGIPEVIQDGKNGYLIDPGDVDRISQCVIKALTSLERENIGKAAQNTIIEYFDIEKNMQKLLSLYATILLANS